MKGLLVFLVVVAAVYYGWKNYGQVFDSMNAKSGEVVVVNNSGTPVDRIRVIAGGRTAVVEALENGATARVGFQPPRDGAFRVVWVYRTRMGEREWSGGNATASEIRTHRFEFTTRENQVSWSSRQKGTEQP